MYTLFVFWNFLGVKSCVYHSEKVHEIGKMRRQKMFSLIWLKSVYVLQTVLTSSGELFAFIECT